MSKKFTFMRLKEAPQGSSIHEFMNDIFHFHDLTNDEEIVDSTISQTGFCQFTHAKK